MFTGIIASIGARLLGIGSMAKSAVASIPAKAWPYIIGAIASVALFFVHQHVAHKQLKAAFDAGYAKRVDEDAKAAAKVVGRVTAVTQPITQKLRTENDAQARDIHRAADAQRLRGPGAALCRDPTLAAGSGGREPASRPGDAAVARLPYPQWGQLIAMPFDDASRFAEQADLNRAEVLTWRSWYSQQWEAWEKLRSSSGASAQPSGSR